MTSVGIHRVTKVEISHTVWDKESWQGKPYSTSKLLITSIGLGHGAEAVVYETQIDLFHESVDGFRGVHESAAHAVVDVR